MKKKHSDQTAVLIEQLLEAKKALFSSRSIREIKFWQQKIEYLQKQLKWSKSKT